MLQKKLHLVEPPELRDVSSLPSHRNAPLPTTKPTPPSGHQSSFSPARNPKTNQKVALDSDPREKHKRCKLSCT
ncbi:hypothetical protein TIFTF001_036851 [Ficus carica]|uniref:Uncharacterized protein n=1 Tax=Ficus carica TaxID=3494 RepID=A0AA88E7N4_FICCA|nr:hypothetical protein TIFTF001_036851 [Ficus carica]